MFSIKKKARKGLMIECRVANGLFPTISVLPLPRVVPAQSWPHAQVLRLLQAGQTRTLQYLQTGLQGRRRQGEMVSMATNKFAVTGVWNKFVAPHDF